MICAVVELTEVYSSKVSLQEMDVFYIWHKNVCKKGVKERWDEEIILSCSTCLSLLFSSLGVLQYFCNGILKYGSIILCILHKICLYVYTK